MKKQCKYCGENIKIHLSTQMDCTISMDDMKTKGMIYSDKGRDEYRISGICEVCFDETCLTESELELYRQKYIKLINKD